MKLLTVLNVLLVALASGATCAARAGAADTNSSPARTITLQPPPGTIQFWTHDAGLRTIPVTEVMARLATPCPDDVEAATSCFESNSTYAYLTVPDDLSGDADRSNLLVIARFLGEIRSRRIPDYHELPRSGNSLPQSVTVSGTNVFNPAASADPEVRQIFQKAVADWERHNATCKLQDDLEMDDVSLTRRLLDACSRLPRNDPANVQLRRQIADAAHLTEAERKKL